MPLRMRSHNTEALLLRRVRRCMLCWSRKTTIHTLRDTYATRMLDRGMPFKELSGLLGHSSVKQTEKYARLIADRVVEKSRMYVNQG